MLNITRGQVVHIGQNLNVSSSDCTISSSNIRVRVPQFLQLLLQLQFHVSSMTQEIRFNCGAIKNIADNVVDSRDEIIFHIESFVSCDAFPRTVSSYSCGVHFTYHCNVIVFTVHPTSSTR